MLFSSIYLSRQEYIFHKSFTEMKIDITKSEDHFQNKNQLSFYFLNGINTFSIFFKSQNLVKKNNLHFPFENPPPYPIIQF